MDDTFGLEDYEIIRRNEVVAHLLCFLKNKNNLQAQKARCKWIKDGDLDSSFYHRTIVNQRKKNEINGLQVGSQWVEEPAIVKRVVKEHFEKQFKKTERTAFPLPADLAKRRLSEEVKLGMISPFTEEEIKEAVWNCESSKSPGADGFNFHFWKACWDIVKGDLIKVFDDFHSNGRFPKGCNSSFIVLIPKKDQVESLNEYRPISLIGSLYKIIFKVLAIRLSRVIGEVISDHQSAFISDRYILDGAVILNEVIEEAKRRKLGRIIFKIDFSKAYDCVHWDFIDDMLKFLNFHPIWRKWIRGCVESAYANVLVNGRPSGEFKLERGIRQGDPLSPFIFLVVAEGLSLLIERAIERSLLDPVLVGKNKISLSHLQYADDTVLLAPNDVKNVKAFKAILRIFEHLSGLGINFSKSNLMGVGIPEVQLHSMADLLGCAVGSIPFTYLGIQVGAAYSKTVNWNFVVEKVRRRISNWKNRNLAFGGRVTLVNSG